MIKKVIVATDGGSVLEVDAIEFEGRAWLVPIWLGEIGGSKMRPLRLVAPRWAPGVQPLPGFEVLNALQVMPLPRSLLEQGVVPPALQALVEVRENPDIMFDIPTGA